MNQTTVKKSRMTEINTQSTDRHDMFYWQSDRPMTMQECAIIFGERHKQITNEKLAVMVREELRNRTCNEDINVDSEAVIGGEHYTVGSVNINRGFALSNGQDIVGRFHPRALKNGYFAVESLVAKIALERGLPAAEPLAVHWSEANDDLDFILFRRVEGQNMKHRIKGHPEEEAALLFETGATMARLHEIECDGYGFFDNEAAQLGTLVGIHKNYRDHVLAALPPNLETIIGAGYITLQQAHRIESLLHDSVILKATPSRLIHNDMADWNIIVKDRKIAALIDWDEAHSGDPVADIACWSLFFTRSRLDGLLEGYRSVSELPVDFDERLHIYRLRYLVSKLALRHKKITYDTSEIMQSLVRAGVEALEDESKYFDL